MAAGLLTGCAYTGKTDIISENTGDETGAVGTYKQIAPDEAKKLMDSESDYITLDARTAEEYAEGHIAGALLIPYDEISARAGDELPDKEKLILVYCRSGRRSKIAAETLAELGYTNVKEFGGIINWTYETVAG